MVKKVLHLIEPRGWRLLIQNFLGRNNFFRGFLLERIVLIEVFEFIGEHCISIVHVSKIVFWIAVLSIVYTLVSSIFCTLKFCFINTNLINIFCLLRARLRYTWIYSQFIKVFELNLVLFQNQFLRLQRAKLFWSRS